MTRSTHPRPPRRRPRPRPPTSRPLDRRGVWLHRALAATWIVLAIPAVLWWKESILFVILASVYANVASEMSAAEAADDRQLAERLDRIEAMLARLDNGAD
jgi:hypothetical protein